MMTLLLRPSLIPEVLAVDLIAKEISRKRAREQQFESSIYTQMLKQIRGVNTD